MTPDAGSSTDEKILTLGHSPDADDAFMFYALTHSRIEVGSYRFKETLEDIESLNRRALRGELDITAASAHAYAYVQDRYALLPCGASLGLGYGPLVVANQPIQLEDLAGARVAIPGRLTTAFLALRLYLSEFQPVETAFDQIPGEVRRGAVDAGVLIHEGQLTYEDEGLHKVADLGELWQAETGLPLPLGVNLIRRDLGEDVIAEVTGLLRASIDWGLNNRSDALAYALQFSSGLDPERGDRFVAMYVNEYTRDLGETGHRAIEHLISWAYERGLIGAAPSLP